jgi:hypothetical protein
VFLNNGLKKFTEKICFISQVRESRNLKSHPLNQQARRKPTTKNVHAQHSRVLN